MLSRYSGTSTLKMDSAVHSRRAGASTPNCTLLQNVTARLIISPLRVGEIRGSHLDPEPGYSVPPPLPRVSMCRHITSHLIRTASFHTGPNSLVTAYYVCVSTSETVGSETRPIGI